jgi:uncharacterized protein YjbJ (UPF0337 family)
VPALETRRRRTDTEEGTCSPVGTQDKMDNAKDRAVGRAKETAGAATDNDEMRDEGRNQQSEGDMKQAGEKVKDAAHKVGDAFKR